MNHKTSIRILFSLCLHFDIYLRFHLHIMNVFVCDRKPTKISIIIIRCDVKHFTWKCVLIMKLQIENQVKGKGRVSHNPSWPAFFLFFFKYLFCSFVWDFSTGGVFFFNKKIPCSKKFQMSTGLFCALRCSSSYLEYSAKKGLL